MICLFYRSFVWLRQHKLFCNCALNGLWPLINIFLHINVMLCVGLQAGQLLCIMFVCICTLIVQPVK